MSGIILHSFRRCPFAIRVRMALEEKGLEYQRIEEDLAAPSTELLKIHPLGRVPVLIHEGRVIPESAIITEYLEERFPAPALMPAAPADRASVRLWTHWCAEELKPDLDLYKYEWESLEPEAREALLARLRDHLERLEAELAHRPYLLGDGFTLADIHLFPFYRQLTRARANGPLAFPAPLDAWLERILSRPSFARVMAK